MITRILKPMNEPALTDGIMRRIIGFAAGGRIPLLKAEDDFIIEKWAVYPIRTLKLWALDEIGKPEEPTGG